MQHIQTVTDNLIHRESGRHAIAKLEANDRAKQNSHEAQEELRLETERHEREMADISEQEQAILAEMAQQAANATGD